MMRIPVALLVLVSIVATPLASMACMARCKPGVMNQHRACREKAHEYIGSHVNHMNHGQMLSQEREPALAASHDHSRHLISSWSCPNGSCASMSAAVPARTRVRTAKLEISSCMAPITECGSPPANSQDSRENFEHPFLAGHL